jgi:hypothetical protein
MRGGVRAPLTSADIEAKFRDNARFGGWEDELTDRWVAWAERAFDAVPSRGLEEFRR